jgi:hypothetical protein
MSNDTIQLPKCPECGGDVAVEAGRLECLDCSLLGLYGAAESDAKLWRLWGAAKDLLKACEHAAMSEHHPACKCHGEYAAFPDRYCTCHVQKARVAVAKAKGGKHE